MNIDLNSLITAMVDAARASAGRRWQLIRPLVEAETRKLAQAAVNAAGNIINGVVGFDLMPGDQPAKEPLGSTPQLSQKFKAGKDL